MFIDLVKSLKNWTIFGETFTCTKRAGAMVAVMETSCLSCTQGTDFLYGTKINQALFHHSPFSALTLLYISLSKASIAS